MRAEKTELAMGILLASMAVAPQICAAQDDPALDTPAQQEAPTAFADDAPHPVLHWGAGDGKSYWIPAADILLFDTSLNQFNRHFSGTDDYDTSFSSFKHNLKHKWVRDNDPFSINQFGHPYQGSMYHGFARSAGLGYWQASAYTILGSAGWEIAGETTPPSINDQFTTGFGGSFLGESLFRLASLMLESGDGDRPGFWRELGAAFISPSTGLNRLAYGDRFDGVFRSHDPAVYTRLSLGVNVSSSAHSNVNRNPNADEPPTPQSYQTGEAIGDFTVTYGLPGKPGYTYNRPFDYFDLKFTAAQSNVLENVIVHGMLFGTDYAVGDSYRGIWGLYGTYDYIAPQIFRISTTGAALGTTGQWWASRTIAVQGSALAGVGYGSAGTIHGAGDRDYHNGVAPQGLVTLRVIFSDRLSLDLTGRDYYVSGLASDEKDGHENISRGEIALTWRVYNLHGITLKYVTTHRDAQYANRDDTRQRVGAFSIGYTLLGQTHAGAVDWRPARDGGP